MTSEAFGRVPSSVAHVLSVWRLHSELGSFRRNSDSCPAQPRNQAVYVCAIIHIRSSRRYTMQCFVDIVVAPGVKIASAACDVVDIIDLH